ncbi:MAG: hypothetical protein QNI84_08895 [Henriciella sp.]|nr:hypothetical protein [Henriciella sp.]
MSLFKKIQSLVRKEPEVIPPPDLSRVLAPGELPPAEAADTEDAPEIDLEAWLERDLQALTDAWTEASRDNPTSKSIKAFRKAVHNFHGASGAYGGGALTRLTGSLQRLIASDHDIQMQPALINLHVQACHAASLATADETDSIAMAVCDSLEKQVERVVSDRPDASPA